MKEDENEKINFKLLSHFVVLLAFDFFRMLTVLWQQQTKKNPNKTKRTNERGLTK